MSSKYELLSDSSVRVVSRPGLVNLWCTCLKGHVERFPWHVVFIDVPVFFFIYFA
jgi:hypothetical protein